MAIGSGCAELVAVADTAYKDHKWWCASTTTCDALVHTAASLQSGRTANALAAASFQSKRTATAPAPGAHSLALRPIFTIVTTAPQIHGTTAIRQSIGHASQICRPIFRPGLS